MYIYPAKPAFSRLISRKNSSAPHDLTIPALPRWPWAPCSQLGSAPSSWTWPGPGPVDLGVGKSKENGGLMVI